MKHRDERSYDRQPRILGLGLVCLDIIRGAGSIRYFNGGSCGNVISALSFLGWHSSVITGSYSDVASNIVNLNLSKMRVQQIKIPGYQPQTPRIIENLIVHDGKYINHEYLLKCPECGHALPPLKPLNRNTANTLIADVDNYNVLYADRASDGIRALKSIFHQRGHWIVYEPNSARNVAAFISNSLESHIVKFSEDRVPYSVADRLRAMAQDGLTVLIVRTEGSKGLSFCYRKRDAKMSSWIHLHSQPVSHYVDACGAGDWCTTGLLFGLVGKYRKSKLWLTKEEVVAALQYGQALAAISCAFIGAQGLFYADVNEKMARQLFKDKRKITMNKIKPTNLTSVLTKGLCQLCLLPRNS